MPVVSSGQRDQVLPFLIDGGAVRGRVVRVGATLDEILGGHGYPPAVAVFLAETLALAAALAGALKYDGIFTLQIQAQGAIPLIVADVTSQGDLRGYARFDEARLAAAEAKGGVAAVPRYLGEGYLAFTVDQGPDTDRYQGIVALQGDTLEACARQYFRQSEQLETAFTLAVRPAAGEGRPWQAAALMIQRMPQGPHSPIFTADEAEEVWNRAGILMASATADELLDLPAGQLLHRLYHADGLVTHEPRPLRARCRCSAERVAGTLKSFPRDEIASLRDDSGEVVVTCEFCKRRYAFAEPDLDRLYGS